VIGQDNGRQAQLGIIGWVPYFSETILEAQQATRVRLAALVGFVGGHSYSPLVLDFDG
jgi:hypothetical protein